MYMYEENFKRVNQEAKEREVAQQNAAIQDAEEVIASGSKVRKPLSIKTACIIAAAILLVSAIAVFFILGGGGLFAA